MEKREFVKKPLQSEWMLSGAGGRCDFFEKQWIHCASSLGLKRAEMDCKFLKDDLNECGRLELSLKRYHRMQEERQKKGLPYQEPPPYDTLSNEKFKNLVF